MKADPCSRWGVVADVRQRGVERARQAEMFVPYWQAAPYHDFRAAIRLESVARQPVQPCVRQSAKLTPNKPVATAPRWQVLGLGSAGNAIWDATASVSPRLGCCSPRSHHGVLSYSSCSTRGDRSNAGARHKAQRVKLVTDALKLAIAGSYSDSSARLWERAMCEPVVRRLQLTADVPGRAALLRSWLGSA